jgi:hypothetical protein
MVKSEVFQMIGEFHVNSVIPKGLLSYFVTLLPKSKCPQSMSDFQPISLLGCLYKIISKVLANRMKGVLNEIVHEQQSGFVPGRNLFDSVLVANEVVDFVHKTKKKCFLFKVDYEKAYDSIDWRFLIYMLRKFGFGDKWVRWMEECLCGGHLSVLGKALKQRDPLSLFLFLVVAEGLGV